MTQLVIAWSLLKSHSRKIFRESLENIDDDTWERGKGWALSIALIMLPYYKHTNPTLVTLAKRMIENVLFNEKNLKAIKGNQPKKVTPYQDINEILFYFSNRIKEILRENLLGLYLFGSLSNGNFNPESSDIDLIIILNKPLSSYELQQIKKFHQQLQLNYQKWCNRLECSYTLVHIFKNILPPKEPRPYYNNGHFYEEALYGNEWIINNYLLYEHGVQIIGPEIKELIMPIDIIEVQKACIRDLFQEWKPKINNSAWLNNSYHQYYLVMTLCRILYTVTCGTVGAKQKAAEWTKAKFPQWSNLIKIAMSWKHGEKIFLKNEIVDFMKFTIEKIKQTTLYNEIDNDGNTRCEYN